MPRSVKIVVSTTAIAAVVAIFVLILVAPPPTSYEWLLTFSILLLLAVIAAALSIRITSQGSASSINFLLHLGAMPLLGSFGAVSLAALSVLIADIFIRDRPPIKLVFNPSQCVVATALAATVYFFFAPAPSLSELDIASSVLPLVGAGVVYFSINSILVTYVIAAESQQPFTELWADLTGRILFIDIALTPIALSVPLLYINWGALGLLLTIVPIIGLRYSLGLNLELRNLNRDLLRVLVKTLEAQDPYTSGHSVRVAENARSIAQELGISQRRIQHIETAALLHDIGKIGQGYGEILRQEGPLTDKQRRLIKEHPRRGADIVEPVRSLDPTVVGAIRHHHERYDGDGYPEGLSGSDIPLGARVIMVADTIDAMATDRPYRTSLSSDEIQEELVRFAGEQFDPEIVQAALDAGILEKEPYSSKGSVV